MSFNLRNRSLLTVQDYTQREFRYLLDLARDLKRAKYAGTEQKHLRGQGDLSHLREDVHPHPLLLRGRLPRPGRARHVSRPRRLADRSQGVVQGHGPRARAHVRRHRVSRRVAERRRGARPACRGARLQRAHRRIPPHADARRRHDHARALRQADRGHQVRLRRRHPVQHGPLAHDRGRADGHGRPDRRSEVAVAGGRVPEDRARARGEVRRRS